MWWDKFEQELKRAYAMIDQEQGRIVYGEAQKLRTIQSKVTADFLLHEKAVINDEITKTPMTMTFNTAITIYQNAAHTKYPDGARNTTTT
mmetsp:Transcript_36347/g.51410  ORF Transcript_36347/g.51410 Transcript_36347/m.51410 type:complete len:90 (-) Transcript_36347:191-460(-)